MELVSEPPSLDIDRIHAPTQEAFLEHYLKLEKPALITGILEHEPAMQKWTPDYFKKISGQTVVRVEHGNVLQNSPTYSHLKLGDFLNKMVGQPSLHSYTELFSAANPVQYLAYFDIFKFLPDLKADISFPLWKGRRTIPIAWIGPPGTFTGLHWDILPNLFAQIYGKKEFILYPPNQSPFLYPSKKYDVGSVLSSVDSRKPDYAAFPLFKHAQGIRVIVEAGQVLFTPRGWWHQVCGLEASISISCFSAGLLEGLGYGIPELLKEYFHKAGLYRKGNCACHKKQAPRFGIS
jgi:ribosomal protein L16 Arg81 hydroxylase